jgi:hypothetical protein
MSKYQMNYPNICIPSIYDNYINKKDIINIFSKILDKNDILNIKIFQKEKEGNKYKKINIYLRKWTDNYKSNKMRELLINNKEVKIVDERNLYIKCIALN